MDTHLLLPFQLNHITPLTLDSAISTKDTARAKFGYKMNRLEGTISVLNIQAENLQAAESRVSDVDVATESRLDLPLRPMSKGHSAQNVEHHSHTKSTGGRMKLTLPQAA